MKYTIVAVAVLACLVAVSAFPGGAEYEDVDSQVEHLRVRRATCDLLSGFGVGHAACAAHCIALNKGFKGGYCNDKAVCVCRR